MLVAVAGDPVFAATGGFAVLVAVSFVPAILAGIVNPVIGMATSRLDRIGGLVDADGVGSRRLS